MTAPDSSGSVVNPIQTHKRGAGMEILLGIVIGVAYVASPGPVNIETMGRGVIGGFRVALAIQVGALIGDLAYALLALAGMARGLMHLPAQALLGLAGTGLLMALGWSALHEWRGIAVVAASSTAGVPIRAPHALPRANDRGRESVRRLRRLVRNAGGAGVVRHAQGPYFPRAISWRLHRPCQCRQPFHSAVSASQQLR